MGTGCYVRKIAQGLGLPLYYRVKGLIIISVVRKWSAGKEMGY